MMCSSSDSVEKKRDIYERLLLPRHPPVFQEWFRKTFSDPYGWYLKIHTEITFSYMKISSKVIWNEYEKNIYIFSFLCGYLLTIDSRPWLIISCQKWYRNYAMFDIQWQHTSILCECQSCVSVWNVPYIWISNTFFFKNRFTQLCPYIN